MGTPGGIGVLPFWSFSHRFAHPRAISVTIFAHNGFAFVAKIKSQDSADISPKQPSLARASLPLARSAGADAVLRA